MITMGGSSLSHSGLTHEQYINPMDFDQDSICDVIDPDDDNDGYPDGRFIPIQ